MAQAHATYLPTRLGSAGPPSRRRSQVARRRKVALSLLGLLVLTLAIAANYGPLHSYLDAKARLQKANAGIASLSAENAELQAELGRLSEADYLESLARQELAYARPGEELYIVTGLDGGPDPAQGAGVTGSQQSTGAGQDPASASDGSPGFLERVLGATSGP